MCYMIIYNFSLDNYVQIKNVFEKNIEYMICIIYEKAKVLVKNLIILVYSMYYDKSPIICMHICLFLLFMNN